ASHRLFVALVAGAGVLGGASGRSRGLCRGCRGRRPTGLATTCGLATAAACGLATAAACGLATAAASGLASSIAARPATAANVLLTLRRWAVLAVSHCGSTRVILCFALTVGVVRGQSRRRASQHEEKSGHQDECVDDQAPRERGSTC